VENNNVSPLPEHCLMIPNLSLLMSQSRSANKRWSTWSFEKINGNGKTIIMATHDYALLMKFPRKHWNVKTLKYLKWFKNSVMLSILIPIYNYNAYPLVKELHSQCLEADWFWDFLYWWRFKVWIQ
jgi:hypothetical protein